jgi:hypothetical protein
MRLLKKVNRHLAKNKDLIVKYPVDFSVEHAEFMILGYA